MSNNRTVFVVAAVLVGLLLLGVIAAGAGVYLYTRAGEQQDRDRLREIDDRIVTILEAQNRREKEIRRVKPAKDDDDLDVDPWDDHGRDQKWATLNDELFRLKAEGDQIRRRRGW